MKKVFAIIALMGVFTFGMTQTMSAQDEEAVDTAAVEQVDSAAVEAAEPEEVAVPEETKEEVSMYKQLKTKFIEGDAGFMAIVAIALIIGLAFCIERIIYLALADVKTDKMLAEVEKALDANDVEKAKTACRNTRGPVASIFYQGLSRYPEGIDMVEKSVVSYGSVQMGQMEKGLTWISLFIALLPMLGFMGTVIGMIGAFDAIEAAGDINPAVVAGGIKVALITTVGGLIGAMILQVFYNYILGKIDTLVNTMEDASISLVDILVDYERKANN